MRFCPSFWQRRNDAILIDNGVFTRFHLHLNPIVWQLVINPDENENGARLAANVHQCAGYFIARTGVCDVELAKLRKAWRVVGASARPLAAFLFIAFIASHVVYIWADANFYRPITMQRANHAAFIAG